jgi:hypothetical protein
MSTSSISIALVLAVTAGLAACGDNSSKPGDSAQTPSTSTTATPSDTTMAQAQNLLDQTMQYLKDGKLDLAEKAVAQLEAMKSSMTPEWQGRVTQARAALDTAKKASMLKTGDTPKVPDSVKLPN